MIDHRRISDWCRAHRDQILAAAKESVRHETPSTQKSLLDQFIGWAQAQLPPTAIAQRLLRSEAGDLLLATVPGREPGPGVLMLAHADTVWDRGEINSRPWMVDRGKAYGPGVYDMKWGLVAGLFALRALWSLDIVPRWTLNYLITTDEETGSINSVDEIRRLATGSRAVLCLEPAIAGTGAIKTARKGVSCYTAEVIGRSSHSGSAPKDGISAIHELADMIGRVRSLADEELGTTVNVGVIWGGTRGNVVAERAGMEVDIRTVRPTEAERIDHELRQIQPTIPGAELELCGGIERPPLVRTPAVVALFQWARQHARSLAFELVEGATGGGSDASFAAAMGVPTLDGLGAVGAGAHSRSEHIDIEASSRRWELLCCLLADLDRMPVG